MSHVAVITGAAQGLGLSIAEALLSAGFTVVLTDVQLDSLTVAVNALDPSGEKTLALKLDVLNKQDFQQALDATVEKFGSCEVLVNNAAMTPTTPVMEITAEEFDSVININLRGTFFGCQVFGEYFSKQHYGRIINMASMAGQMGGTASGAHYASSKGAILTLNKIFARQFADQGVTVNSVAPGPVDVPSIRDKVPAAKLQDIIDNMIPVKALTSPVFIANMVAMLASPEANTVTGACWDINGGIFMR
jgi:3-oxoacyl-[acyl-carrier protein] reductase